MRKSITFMIMMLFLLLPTAIFANTTSAEVTKASPIQFEQNEYFRITQPIKDKMSVFDKDLNVTGEARYNVKIRMQLFNKIENDRLYPQDAYRTYELDPVGFSQTFNELIELREGDNKIRFLYEYTNDKNELIEGRLIIYVTRRTEEEKIAIKNLRIDNMEQFTGDVKK
ncbi:MAG TPA: hypothetical protein GX707_19030 [Epulopiscium sp.]|nr:hypothetical protein [Candidatus Epulonipiscium sp.]